MPSTSFWFPIGPNRSWKIFKAGQGKDKSLNLIRVVLTNALLSFQWEIDQIIHKLFVELPYILWDFGKLILHKIGKLKDNIKV